jgi:hypothetical protein
MSSSHSEAAAILFDLQDGPFSQLLRALLAFNLEQPYNGCAAVAEGPNQRLSRKTLASIICGVSRIPFPRP